MRRETLQPAEFDIAAIPREFPQFGRSIWNLVRTRREAFGSGGSLACCKGVKGGCECAERHAEAFRGSCDGCAHVGWGLAMELRAIEGIDSDQPWSERQEQVLGPQGKKALDVVNDCARLSDTTRMVTGDQGRPVCGADITDTLARRVQNSWWNRYVDGASQNSIENEWAPLGANDFKRDSEGMKGPLGGCASPGCGSTFTLCGYCVKADVPANIGAGAAVGGKNVRRIARQLETFGYGKDDRWDIASYAVGDQWRETLRREGQRQSGSGNLSLAIGLSVKDGLCQIVANLPGKCGDDSNKSGVSMFRACDPCMEAYVA